VSGSPTTPAARAQPETLRTPRFRYSIPARLPFWIVDVIYGRQRARRKFSPYAVSDMPAICIGS
jgi:hypothetical protein